MSGMELLLRAAACSGDFTSRGRLVDPRAGRSNMNTNGSRTRPLSLSNDYKASLPPKKRAKLGPQASDATLPPPSQALESSSPPPHSGLHSAIIRALVLGSGHADSRPVGPGPDGPPSEATRRVSRAGRGRGAPSHGAIIGPFVRRGVAPSKRKLVEDVTPSKRFFSYEGRRAGKPIKTRGVPSKGVKDVDGNDVGMGYFSAIPRRVSPAASPVGLS